NPKAYYRTGPPAREPQAWLAGATRRQGSWWDHWAQWVHARSGAQRAAPTALGCQRYEALENAPGRYVKNK
ncbi:MAG TPA: hypothetical protein VIV12_21845, partial [Streptosporangiaceae bacterium]